MLVASFALPSSGMPSVMQPSSEPRFSAQYRRYHHFVGHALRRVGVPEADVDRLSDPGRLEDAYPTLRVVLLRSVGIPDARIAERDRP